MKHKAISYGAMMLVMVSLTLVGAHSCLPESGADVCPSGRICPPGWRCAAAQDACIQGSCGDGVVDRGEVCDDGNQISGDGCSADCRSVERCGNGIIDTAAGEVCDDGNQISGDGCSADCRSDERCGNGVVDAHLGEECDDGNGRSDDACPDGPGGAGEPAGTCQWARCGDGHVRAGVEHCDMGSDEDGNPYDTEECDADCTWAECGDGHVNAVAGEECDDGNRDNRDGCPDRRDTDTELRQLEVCKWARCGDGHVWAGVEECDDGDQVHDGQCTPECQTPGVCGNGVLEPGEQCDDGNQRTDDICPSGPDGTCTLARCGDGFVWRQGGEACDDGDDDTDDACPSGPLGTCQPARCGDGFLWSAEHGGDEECEEDAHCNDPIKNQCDSKICRCF